MSRKPWIFGIGNPLADILVEVTDEELKQLGLHKGTMHLIDKTRHDELISFAQEREASYLCGGSCPNTVIALASFGVPGALAGSIGKDQNGNIYRTTLARHAVTDALKVCGDPTGTSIILVTPDCERTMNTFLGANRKFSPEDVDSTLLEASKVFHFTGYMWDTENQKQAVLRALNISHACKLLVSFDIADPFAVSRNREAFLKIISQHADIVFANIEEARILFDRYDASACAEKMGQLCSTAIVKHGKHGSYISHNGKTEHIPPFTAVSVDTTGAGDMYAAGFLLGLYTGASCYESGRCASYLAGRIVQKQGAQFTPDEAVQMHRNLGKLGLLTQE